MSSDSTDDAARSLMRQVDEIGARFEEAWKSGSEPRIEDFLQQLPGDTNPELLLALIERDVVFRSEQGAAPDLETYTARFPEQASRIRNSLSAAHGRTVLPETDHYPAPVAGGAA